MGRRFDVCGFVVCEVVVVVVVVFHLLRLPSSSYSVIMNVLIYESLTTTVTTVTTVTTTHCVFV
jgi:hypothetical protein